MLKYNIFETKQFLNDLDDLEKKDKNRIYNKLIKFVYPQIKESPYYGLNIKKLLGYKPDTWRYRIGNYRIFYEINDKEKMIYILTIEKRKDSY